MNTTTLNPTQPALFLNGLSNDEMYAASQRRDTEYDGVFYLAVKTTGIFCRPSCPARMPLQKNVSFFETTTDCLSAGYRPCKKCRPMEVAGAMPRWLADLVEHFQSDPSRKWNDQDIREFGVDPKRVRRWFQQNHGITFHSYLRSRRLSTALSQLSLGDDPTQVAFDAGYESLSGFRDAFQKWFGATPGRAVKGTDNGSMVVNRIPTILGPMVAAASADRLWLLEYADRRMLETQFKRLAKISNCRFCPGENKLIQQTAKQIDDYFCGKLSEFTIPMAVDGTEFQQQVWSELLKIPYGTTTSYESIAKTIKKPNAQRAVGRANGDNRIAIMIPCHRVIRSDGQLSGYGGGLRRKQWLLDHERS